MGGGGVCDFSLSVKEYAPDIFPLLISPPF